jgi:hypothetical protein
LNGLYICGYVWSAGSNWHSSRNVRGRGPGRRLASRSGRGRCLRTSGTARSRALASRLHVVWPSWSRFTGAYFPHPQMQPPRHAGVGYASIARGYHGRGISDVQVGALRRLRARGVLETGHDGNPVVVVHECVVADQRWRAPSRRTCLHSRRVAAGLGAHDILPTLRVDTMCPCCAWSCGAASRRSPQ